MSDDEILARLFAVQRTGGLRIEPAAVPTPAQDGPLVVLLACVYAVGQMTTPDGGSPGAVGG